MDQPALYLAISVILYLLFLTLKHFFLQHDIPFVTVVSSLKRLLRYSLGSVALGSLVVSVVEWVRFILECLRRKLKLVDSARESCFGKATSSSSQCCLGCIDWTLKSVNRNAYIMVNTKLCYWHHRFHPHVTFFLSFCLICGVNTPAVLAA
jgi:hypothetical protein